MNDDLPEYEDRHSGQEHPTPVIKTEIHWIGFVIALGVIILLVKGCGG